MKKIKILTGLVSLPIIGSSLLPLSSCGNKGGGETSGEISCITSKSMEIMEGTTTDFKFKFEAKPYDNKVTVQIENASQTQPKVEFKDSTSNSSSVVATVDSQNKFTLHIGFVDEQTTTCESKFNLIFSYKKDDTQPTISFKMEGFSLKFVDPSTVQHTVTFTISGSGRLEGDLTTKVIHGKTWADVKKPTPVDSTNLVFAGWYNGETQMKDTDLIKSDLTIKALFVSCTPTTCFNFSYGKDGAKILSCNQSIQTYQDIIIPECVTKDETTYKVTEINSNAFEQYAPASMENIELSRYIKQVSSSAFINCTNLKTITFNSDLETIEANAFSGCTKLKKATFRNDHIWEQMGGSHVNTLTPSTNATNFKNTQGTDPTGTNWGTTGLTSEKAGIVSLTVASQKTSYFPGDKLNLTSMSVKANWTDDRDPTDVKDQCTTSPGEGSILSEYNKSVLVKHTPSGKSYKFNINVGETISVKTLPKTSYFPGDKLDLTGMKIIATKSDGATKDITSECTTEPAAGTVLTKDDTKVVVTHTSTGKTCEFNITVDGAISVKTLPKTSYFPGDKLDLTNMEIIATRFDGTTKDIAISECTTEPAAGTVLTKDHTKVIVTHTSTGKTCEFNIIVGETISVKTKPKTGYVSGQKLDITNMEIIATRSDGTTKDITSECTTTPEAGTVLTKDDTKVIVTHTSTGKTCEFNITVGTPFEDDLWENVINYANLGLAKLKEKYCVSSFIGLERKVTINNKEHIVRVIGEEHDTIAGTSNKAALTFELVTLLSDSNGDKMESKWDTTNNYDYTNSILRWNLNGNGSGTKPEGTWANSALSMLPSELQSGIKSVNKKVATYDGTDPWSEDHYVVKEEGYNDKLFPLTYTEMAQSGSWYAEAEGTAYKYWTDHNEDQYRIKKDAAGYAYYYWLCSPYTRYSDNAWLVNFGGYFNYSDYVGNTNGVSFGFCI